MKKRGIRTKKRKKSGVWVKKRKKSGVWVKKTEKEEVGNTGEEEEEVGSVGEEEEEVGSVGEEEEEVGNAGEEEEEVGNAGEEAGNAGEEVVNIGEQEAREESSPNEDSEEPEESDEEPDEASSTDEESEEDEQMTGRESSPLIIEMLPEHSLEAFTVSNLTAFKQTVRERIKQIIFRILSVVFLFPTINDIRLKFERGNAFFGGLQIVFLLFSDIVGCILSIYLLYVENEEEAEEITDSNSDMEISEDFEEIEEYRDPGNNSADRTESIGENKNEINEKAHGSSKTALKGEVLIESSGNKWGCFKWLQHMRIELWKN